MNHPFTSCKPGHALSLIILGAATLTLGNSALAQVDAATAAELREQIAVLSARLDELETAETQGGGSEPSGQWSERFEFSGDLRPRYEYIDDATRPDARNRLRLRARLGVDAAVNDNWSAHLGLATGDDDPISTNQTLGQGGSTKDIRLDMAYLAYRGLENTTVYAGKYANVFHRAGGEQLIFDGDYRPEGLAMAYETESLFVNAAAMILESDELSAGTGPTATLWGLQLGYTHALNSGDGLTAGLGYFHAPVQGKRPFYTNFPYGNSVTDNNLFIHNYEMLDLFAEYDLELGAAGLTLFGEYVRNLDADSGDSGWAVGGAAGLGAFALGYSYQDIGRDAVFSPLNNSDFAGGLSGSSGHTVSGELELAPNTAVGFTWFMNEIGDLETDYERFQFDLTVDF